jgi:hypothetical protein
MKPGYDSRPSVPAATPKREAVRLRMLDVTCSCQYAEPEARANRARRGRLQMVGKGLGRGGEGRGGWRA